MPRIDKTMLKGLGDSIIVASNRTIADEVLEVVLWREDSELFRQFVSDLWDAYNARWGMYHDGSDFPVTQDEMLRYAFTAVKTRVSRVNNDRFHLRCDDTWQLPAPLAAAINGIGRVSIEAPVLTIVPRWNPDYDQYILDQRTWLRITERLRAVSHDDNVKIVLVKALAGDRSGDEHMMNLVPVRDELGRIVQIAHRTQPVDAIAAAVYLISGFDPEVYSGITLAQHPLLLPAWYIERAAVMQTLWRYSMSAVA